MTKADETMRKAILEYIGAHPDCTSIQISEALDHSPKAVRGMLGWLNRSGLVDVGKKVGEDRAFTWRLADDQ